jgi:hypothetical protein
MMTARELAICVQIAGGNELDCALIEHARYISRNVLAETLTCVVNNAPMATFSLEENSWKIGSRLQAVLLGLGLMDPDGRFIESKARELITNFDEEWPLNEPVEPE